MCGLNCIFNFETSQNRSDDLKRLRLMNDALVHRGPDGEGFFYDDVVALGHRRLSIIDLRVVAAQPMADSSENYIIVFNGEIYNYIEIRTELKNIGYQFKTESDTEVALIAYKAWGTECFAKFNGMWAIVIYDKIQKKIIVSRDRFGVKPLYFAERNGAIIFSSEIFPIRKLYSLRSANLGKVHDYLRYGYRNSDGKTFYSDVFEFPPACFQEIRTDGKGPVVKYWKVSLLHNCFDTRRSDMREEFRELITDAVRIRFRSDVPVALLQSGGLDSSIIASIVNDLAEKSLLKPGIGAFTASFPEFEFDELDNVKLLYEKIPNINLHVVHPTADSLVENIEQFVLRMGEPVFSPTSFAHWLTMQAVASNGVRVVLNGQGADELFAGYAQYIVGNHLLDVGLSKPSTFLREWRGANANLGISDIQLLLQLAKSVTGRRAASKIRSRFIEGTTQVLSKKFVTANDGYLLNDRVVLSGNSLDYVLLNQIEKYSFGQILHYEDHSSMAQSVEIRSPFLDYRIAEFAFNLMRSDKFAAGVTKSILRDSYSSVLPKRISGNNRKIGFYTPVANWFAKGPLRTYCEKLFYSEEFNSRQYVDVSKFRKVLFGTSIPSNFPAWRFVNLELWAKLSGIENL